jgi:hypothetical protein
VPDAPRRVPPLSDRPRSTGLLEPTSGASMSGKVPIEY